MNEELDSRLVKSGGYGSLEGARTSYTSKFPARGERMSLLQKDCAREHVEVEPVL